MIPHTQNNLTPGDSTLPYGVLQKHQNPVFIETGTLNGGGIALALQFPFETVHSIEIDPQSHANALAMFAGEKRVRLHLGDSAVVLPELIKTIDVPITFWLDGHTPHTPLYQELRSIALHPIKTHTIIIDDLRVFGKTLWGLEVDLKTTLELLLAINPAYKIELEDSCNGPKDILVAHP
jgi:hypothetical protein